MLDRVSRNTPLKLHQMQAQSLTILSDVQASPLSSQVDVRNALDIKSAGPYPLRYTKWCIVPALYIFMFICGHRKICHRTQAWRAEVSASLYRLGGCDIENVAVPSVQVDSVACPILSGHASMECNMLAVSNGLSATSLEPVIPGTSRRYVYAFQKSRST